MITLNYSDENDVTTTDSKTFPSQNQKAFGESVMMAAGMELMIGLRKQKGMEDNLSMLSYPASTNSEDYTDIFGMLFTYLKI